MTAVPSDETAKLRLENARLQAELRAAGDRRNASAEILRAIASASGDAGQALQQIAETTARLFGAPSVRIRIAENGQWSRAIAVGTSAKRVDAELSAAQLGIGSKNLSGTVLLENRQIHIPDLDNIDPEIAHWPGLPLARAEGTRTMAGTPLRREGKAIGVLVVYRDRLAPFTSDELALLQSFGDQAAIAIENARLFNQTREALERQNATAEILRTIASAPSDAERSLYQIAETSARLFGATSATIRIADADGGWSKIIRVGDSSKQVGAGLGEADVRVGGRNTPGTIVAENRQVHIPDLDNLDPEMADWPGLPHARAAGTRSMSGSPLRLEGKAIGALIVYRDRLAPFTEEELALQQSFADQAAIAIENARLFNETREALEQQKASADILSVISNSVADTQPVFDKILRSIEHLFGGEERFIYLAGEDGLLRVGAAHGPNAERVRALYPVPLEGTASEMAFRERRLVSYADVFNDPDVPSGVREIARRIGHNYSMALAPMLWEGRAIGSIFVARTSMVPFSEKECSLLRSFADQAVIAIQNARLFNETREALERQTATAEILKVIASSPSDVQPVFDAIAESAKRLAGGHTVTVTRVVDEMVHLAAFSAGSEAGTRELKNSFPTPISSQGIHSRVARSGQLAFRTDMETEPDLTPAMKELARARGYRSILVVPMLREGIAIGTIAVTRRDPGLFAENVIDLLRSFADQAVIAIENARLFNETKEALERQTATAEVLKVIASSPSDTTPVFEAIASSANRLLGGFSTAVFRFVDGTSYLAAFTPTHPTADEVLKASFPQPLADFRPFELAKTGVPVQIADTETSFDEIRNIARARGFRSMLFSPLISIGTPIGLISVTRLQPGSFAAHHVQLLQTFADQAVIAIENARLFNETREALERQTATADILKVIASSPDDVQPVFDAIATSSKQLLGGFSATVFRFVDGVVNLAAYTPVSPAADKVLTTSFPRPAANLPFFELAKRGEVVQEADSETNPDAGMRELSRARGFRSSLFSPLMSKGTPIGLIVVTRKEPGSFAAHHIQLLQTFADQAVIAIENVRLFNETKEALERQTATAEILKVIASSPSDVQPVFDVIVERAVQLCGARMGRVYRYDGNLIHMVGGHGLSAPSREGAQRPFPRPATDDTIVGRVMLSRQLNILADLNEDETVPPLSRQMITALGARSQLTMPMLLAGEPIGAITLSWVEPRGHADQTIALLQTFADQAVIAIENVRLFNEVKQRTEDLSEALQQQTATAEVLKVISRSAFDLQSVLDTLVNSASTLCSADQGMLLLLEDGILKPLSYFGPHPDKFEFRKSLAAAPHRGNLSGRAVLDGQIAHVADVLIDPEFTNNPWQQLTGFRGMLAVPLMRQGQPIGAMALSRTTTGLFADRQIELVTTFADQAVIAIENVRLFDEVQSKTGELTEALEYQTATGDVLNVISRSPNNLQPVMDTIVHTTRRLCQSEYALMLRREDDGVYRIAAHSNASPELMAWMQDNPVVAGDGSAVGIVAAEKQTVHLPDALADPRFTDLRRQRHSKARTMLGVPLLLDQNVIGVVFLARTEVKPFSDKQVELVTSFADQAVIAISNVGLFNEVQERTRELSQSLDDLRTAQDRLIQTEKLASLGQLTAGIAHEIKNPLNFVNNFSSLSAELTDELNDVLKSAELSGKIRKEVDELTGLLKDNLQKVVQHGKRADSIVKNMLLHSREGSGDHRPADINALLDESINLAYHGARAEKPQFNVTLQRDFDEKAGIIEVFPQEITRVFLNLISNGFYAVTKRKTENGGSAFEPVVRATTRNRGDSVEIRIRDNGTGIPAEVKEKMFNPFFTTKPAGEGTGLGLSMSHDIIVKQHGGSIDVETEPEQFTEFTIVLPRASILQNKKRGQS